MVNDYKGNGIGRSEELPLSGRQYTTGDNKLNLACVGASKPFRDSADDRVVSEINGTGPTPTVSENAEVGIGPRVPPIVPPCLPGRPCFYEGTVNSQGQRDYFDYQSVVRHPSNYDTDNDGIADAFERALISQYSNLRSLADIDHTTNADGDQYLDVEEFINALARCPGVSEGF